MYYFILDGHNFNNRIGTKYSNIKIISMNVRFQKDTHLKIPTMRFETGFIGTGNVQTFSLST